MTDIKDLVFSMTYDGNKNQELNFSFIYNLYSENETQIPDNVILNKNNTKKNKFIRIQLENIVDNYNNTFLIPDGPLSFIYDLADKDLYSSEREFFNKLDNLIPTRINLTTDYKFNEVKSFFSIHKSSNSNIDEDRIRNLDRSNNLSIVRLDQYTRDLKNKEFIELFNYNNFSNYEKVVNNEKVNIARKNKKDFIKKYLSGNLLPGLHPISSSINDGNVEKYSNLNAFYCGR